jgi:hypothetical protein
VFQQILKECLAHGAPCQVMLCAKGNLEEFLKNHFKDAPIDCEKCAHSTSAGEHGARICLKTQPCYHLINNAKIVSIKIIKEEHVTYFLFYYSATFQNKLRPKNEELITITIDEEGHVFDNAEFTKEALFRNPKLETKNSKTRHSSPIFDKAKTSADQRLDDILKEKLVLFELPLIAQRRSKLRSFNKRLKRSFLEKMISKKQGFENENWRSSCEAILRREKESLLTNLTVKFLNLLIINTVKVRFEVKLDNNSTIHASTILGINLPPEITCPICRQNFNEGYATQDSLYVCKNCTKQSIETAKIYSTKASLRLDETLREYIEPDMGFICSVCGKKHSRLLEFKCSYDNSSLCIHHYDLCDICGKEFSKLNLSYTDEFRRQLCPNHVHKTDERNV